MTNVEALKALYEAFGGDPADVADLTTIAEIIAALAAFISEGGAAELPAVTKSDNGKVLTVVSGQWKAAALPAPTT